jgi:hypothetical protein
MIPGNTNRNGKWGFAWLCLCLALALHVADEAWHDFPAFFNLQANTVHDIWPALPLFHIAFVPWIISLVVLTLVLLGLTPTAWRNVEWMRIPSRIFAVIMVINGAAHIGVSIRYGFLAPGVLSSPLVIIFAAALWAAVPAYQPKRKDNL